MVVNAAFMFGQMIFEVPTGVVADTIGRRTSLMLSMVVLVAATLLYAYTPALGWGLPGFVLASVLLGFGYTFQTGAFDAWLVDALDSTGFVGPKDTIFARGQIASSAGMLAGSLMGGVFGQIGLTLPYILRAGLIGVCFVLIVFTVDDAGFERRSLTLSSFGRETRNIFEAGAQYGWHSPVVRPLFFVSAVSGLYLMYGFYSWQPYVLELLGRPDAVWLLGVFQAGFSAVGILGNMLVGRIMGEGEQRRDPARVLEAFMWFNAVVVLGIAVIGLLQPDPGWVPAGLAVFLWLVFGLIFGVSTPVRMAYINENIPSSQRATVLSLDAFFADAGGAAGQPAMGRLSDAVSIPVAWLVGSLFLAASAPLYRMSGRAARIAKKELQ